MQLTGSIIFTAAPADYSACLAARYLAGLGIGLITVPFLIHNYRRWGVITQHPGLGKFGKSLGKILFRRIDQ